MDEEKQSESKIQVLDRRRFSDSAQTEEGGDELESEVGQGSSDKMDSTGGTDIGDPEIAEKKASADSFKESEGSNTAVDFPSFIVSLATQALMLMGEVPNPESQTTSMNLSAAKQTIDIIGLLEEKTQGNLTQEEMELLREVLSSLRIAFVNKLKQ